MSDRRTFVKGLTALPVAAAEVVIDYAFRTGMIPRRFSVDELFNGLDGHSRLIAELEYPARAWRTVGRHENDAGHCDWLGAMRV